VRRNRGAGAKAAAKGECQRDYYRANRTHLNIDVDGGEDGAAQALRPQTLSDVLIEVESGPFDLGHLERVLRRQDSSRAVRHGRSETYNWLYHRLDESREERRNKPIRRSAGPITRLSGYVDDRHICENRCLLVSG
jgi:hypothetical protein